MSWRQFGAAFAVWFASGLLLRLVGLFDFGYVPGSGDTPYPGEWNNWEEAFDVVWVVVPLVFGFVTLFILTGSV